MALNPLNSSNLEHLALKGLIQLCVSSFTVVKNLIRLMDECAFCIVSRCDRYICTGGKITELTDDVRSTLQMDVVDKMAGQGLRTIGVAYRELTPGI